jgi:hypothetical protein
MCSAPKGDLKATAEAVHFDGGTWSTTPNAVDVLHYRVLASNFVLLWFPGANRGQGFGTSGKVLEGLLHHPLCFRISGSCE